MPTEVQPSDRGSLADSRVVPLSTMDELCLHLDTERFPWTIEFEIRAPGAIDESRLRDAVARAAAQHPMARARMRPYRLTDRVYEWEILDEIADDPVWVLRADDDVEMAERRAFIISAGIALDEAPPFRVWLVRRPGGDSLLLSANHVATDGMGTMRLMRSIVRAYADAPDPVMPIDPVADRDVKRIAGPTSALDRLSRLVGYGGGLRHAGGRLSRISVDGGEEGASGFGVHHEVVASEDFAALDPRRHTDATFNDLLLAALHLAIEDWNADHFAETDRITLMMPVNVRPREAWTETMANLSMMAQIHSSPADRDDAAALVRSVAAQTTRVKKSSSATVLLEVLDHSDWLPAVAKQAVPLLSPLSNDALIDTAVLSNLGRVDEPFDFGPGPWTSSAATEVWFSPPARMPLAIGVGAATLDGTLYLSFRYCRAQFDAPAAASFAEYYRRALTFLG